MLQFFPLRSSCTAAANIKFVDGANTTTEYTYDQNGNMTSDANKGISSIESNHLNLPTSVSIAGGTISYIYDAVGTKLKKTVGSTVTEYAGNYIYEGNTTSTNLQFFNHPEGYVSPSAVEGQYNYIYQYKDHLGNIRLSYQDANGDGDIDVTNDPMTTEIVEENNYYPFGLEHKGYNNVISGTENNFKTFQGKEEEKELGRNTYDFGWRAFDPAIARWSNIDPLAERYLKTSPYVFTANNPIYNIEVDGRYFEGKDEKRAARLQRKAEKRAAKLNKKADKLEAKGKDIGDLRDRAGQLTQSSQDIQDMRSNEDTQFRYANTNGKEAKGLGIKGKPATVGTGTNDKGDNVVTMFTGSNTGQKLHETRHGGQHSRGEINAITQTRGLDAEVSAYKAEFAYDGKLKYMTHNFDQTNIISRTLLDAQKIVPGTLKNINSMNQINTNMVLDIGEFYTGQNGQGTYVVPVYSGGSINNNN